MKKYLFVLLFLTACSFNILRDDSDVQMYSIWVHKPIEYANPFIQTFPDTIMITNIKKGWVEIHNYHNSQVEYYFREISINELKNYYRTCQ